MAIDGGLRKLFVDHLKGWHVQPIETGGTGQGIPDAHCAGQGTSCWVEMKRTDANAVAIDGMQVGWHERHHRAGGRTFVAVRRVTSPGPRKGAATDTLFIFRGADIRALHGGGLNGAIPILICKGSPAQWDWDAVKAALAS